MTDNRDDWDLGDDEEFVLDDLDTENTTPEQPAANGGEPELDDLFDQADQDADQEFVVDDTTDAAPTSLEDVFSGAAPGSEVEGESAEDETLFAATDPVDSPHLFSEARPGFAEDGGEDWAGADMSLEQMGVVGDGDDEGDGFADVDPLMRDAGDSFGVDDDLELILDEDVEMNAALAGAAESETDNDLDPDAAEFADELSDVASGDDLATADDDDWSLTDAGGDEVFVLSDDNEGLDSETEAVGTESEAESDWNLGEAVAADENDIVSMPEMQTDDVGGMSEAESADGDSATADQGEDWDEAAHVRAAMAEAGIDLNLQPQGDGWEQVELGSAEDEGELELGSEDLEEPVEEDWTPVESVGLDDEEAFAGSGDGEVDPIYGEEGAETEETAWEGEDPDYSEYEEDYVDDTLEQPMTVVGSPRRRSFAWVGAMAALLLVGASGVFFLKPEWLGMEGQGSTEIDTVALQRPSVDLGLQAPVDPVTTTDPTTTDPTVAGGGSEPGVTDPSTTDPTTTDPTTTDPVTTDPTVAGGGTEPGVTDPIATDPTTTDPTTTDPVTTDPTVAGGGTEPGVTDPVTTDPTTTDPITTDPTVAGGGTDPGVTDPGVADPTVAISDTNPGAPVPVDPTLVGTAQDPKLGAEPNPQVGAHSIGDDVYIAGRGADEPDLPSRLQGPALEVAAGSKALAQLENGNFFVGTVKKASEALVTLALEEGEISIRRASLVRLTALASSDYAELKRAERGFVRLVNNNLLEGSVLEGLGDGHVILEVSESRVLIPRSEIEEVGEAKEAEVQIDTSDSDAWLLRMIEDEMRKSEAQREAEGKAGGKGEGRPALPVTPLPDPARPNPATPGK